MDDQDRIERKTRDQRFAVVLLDCIAQCNARAFPTQDEYEAAIKKMLRERCFPEVEPKPPAVKPAGWLVDDGFMLTDPQDEYAVPLYAHPPAVDVKRLEELEVLVESLRRELNIFYADEMRT